MTEPDPQTSLGAIKTADGISISSKPDVQRAVEKLSEHGKITSETMMALAGTIGNPLHNKMTPEHISQVLTFGADHDEREFKLAQSQQEIEEKQNVRTHRYGLCYFLAMLGLVVFVAVLFKDNAAVLVPTLTAVGGMVSGFLAGMGYAKSKS